MTRKTPYSIRQGDVPLVKVAKLPADCTEVPLDNGRIVLAYGEVTGHSHAIADHVARDAAKEMADSAIGHAMRKACLWKAPSGQRFLEVREAVHLGHEEHKLVSGLLGNPDGTTTIEPGIYKQPVQCEYTPEERRPVAD